MIEIGKAIGGAAAMWIPIAGCATFLLWPARKPIATRFEGMRSAGPISFDDPATQQQSSPDAGAAIDAAIDAAAPAAKIAIAGDAAVGGDVGPMKTIQHAPGVLPPKLTAETDDFVRKLVFGWKFERVLRLIFFEQIQLLRAIKAATSVDMKIASQFYANMTPQYRKAASVFDFIKFLTDWRLVSTTQVGDGVIYGLTVDGLAFLDYADKVAAGIVFPGITDAAPGYVWGSAPLPRLAGEPPPDFAD